jgi:quinol monooxygenase YgiN
VGEQISWLIELAVQPEGLEPFRTLMSEMVESTRGESGALTYEWFVISDDGGRVHISERYTDSAAVIAHLTTFGQKFASRFLALVSPTASMSTGRHPPTRRPSSTEWAQSTSGLSAASHAS